MKDLDYLLPFQDQIDWPSLVDLKNERNSWWERESAKKWLINEYPSLEVSQKKFNQDYVELSDSEVIKNPQKTKELMSLATQLIPWKKGPFKLFDIEIDAEWRSDQKWQRIEPHLVDLKDKVILDVGCNNGYFMFRMAHHRPRLVLGFDPVLPMQAQFDLIQNYAQCKNLHFELFGVEHMPLFKKLFDVIFHMGIVYHHRHPIQQMIDIRESLRPGGTVYLETIGIPGEESYALFPEDRYARMKNVWFIPTLSCFCNWASKAKLVNVTVLADTDLNQEEQRSTKWCPPPFKSLKDSLDPEDSSVTIEGHPAPRRFLIKAERNPNG